MRELLIPKFNNNDVDCVLVAWMYASGDTVPTNGVVAEIETSKALEDLVIEQGGVLHQLVKATTECAVGRIIALIFDTEQERLDYLAAPADGTGAGANVAAADDPVLTNSARKLAQAHEISMDRILALGKSVVKSDDIESLIEQHKLPKESVRAPREGTTRELTRRQRLIAAVVSESHRTIPAASVAAKIDLTTVRDRLEVNAAEPGGDPPMAIGPVELMVKAIAAQHTDLPLLFGSQLDDSTVLVPDQVGIGVTIDVGTGLFVPVIRDAAAATLTEIASQLMGYRVKALRESFKEEDLTGAHITLSLHNDPAITFAQPIVYPGQSAVVTLCGSERQVTLDVDGRPQWRDYATIGVCYDHRVINGREAMLFLRGIKRWIEGDSC